MVLLSLYSSLFVLNNVSFMHFSGTMYCKVLYFVISLHHQNIKNNLKQKNYEQQALLFV